MPPRCGRRAWSRSRSTPTTRARSAAAASGNFAALLRLRPLDCRDQHRRPVFRHPLFLKAHADRITAALAQFPGGGRDAFVLFSAHNLPEKLIRRGDPYLDQVRGTVDRLLPAIGDRPWRLAFQSRSGPVKWLAPEVADTLRALAAEGRNRC